MCNTQTQYTVQFLRNKSAAILDTYVYVATTFLRQRDNATETFKDLPE